MFKILGYSGFWVAWNFGLFGVLGCSGFWTVRFFLCCWFFKYEIKILELEFHFNGWALSAILGAGALVSVTRKPCAQKLVLSITGIMTPHQFPGR